MNWQEGISVFIAVFCALYVMREFVQPFLQTGSCGGCSGCGSKDTTLNIEPAPRTD